MKWRFVALCILCLAGTCAFNWAKIPMNGGACGQGNNCASCHQGSAPRTHTPDFLAVGHGPPALINRQQCYGCHQQQSCAACHLKEPPLWHTEAFRNPACGAQQRDEHALLATRHQSSCAECHSQRFQIQCASCHRPDEEFCN